MNKCVRPAPTWQTSEQGQKLLINGRFLTRPATGVDRYATEIFRSVSKLGGGPIEALIPGGSTVRPVFSPEMVKIQPMGRLKGHLWEQVELPLRVGDEPLVGLCNTGPVICEKQLVVVHDAATLANPDNYSAAFRHWYRFMLSRLSAKARVMGTVSKFSAGELGKYLGQRPKGIEVIRQGGEHILREAADTAIVDTLGLAGRPFVLAVGSASANKNFIAAAKAVERLSGNPLLLVAVGGGDQRVFTAADVQSNVIVRAGYVTDAQLRALYEAAFCFIFPSFYEGFGLPPLEAMNCGCPVIASKRASIPEVCGDAVLYCDPSDPDTITHHLSQLLASPALREEMRQAGFARTKLFGWDLGGRDLLDLYRTQFR